MRLRKHSNKNINTKGSFGEQRGTETTQVVAECFSTAFSRKALLPVPPQPLLIRAAFLSFYVHGNRNVSDP